MVTGSRGVVSLPGGFKYRDAATIRAILLASRYPPWPVLPTLSPRFARRYQPWLDKTARDNRRKEEAGRRGKSGPVFLPSAGLTTKTHTFPEPLFYSQSWDIRPPREIWIRMLVDWRDKMDRKMKKITRKGSVRGRGSGRLRGRNKDRVRSRGKGGGRGRGRGRGRALA